MAAKYDIELLRGATFLLTFNVKDGTVPRQWVTDAYVADMQVRPEPGTPTLIAEFSTLNGRITLDDAGNVVIAMAAVDTAALVPGSYFYDLKTTHSVAPVLAERLVEGAFNVVDEVTV